MSDTEELVRLVARALEPVGAATDAPLMVHMALADVSDEFDPSDLVQLNVFVLGALADVLEQALPADKAESVIERLRLACEPMPAADVGDGAVAPVKAVTSNRIVLLAHTEALRGEIQRALDSSRFDVVSSPDPATCIVHCAAVRPALVICDGDALDADHSKFLRLLSRSLAGDPPPMLLLASEPIATGSELAAVAIKPIDAVALLPTIEQLATAHRWQV